MRIPRNTPQLALSALLLLVSSLNNAHADGPEGGDEPTGSVVMVSGGSAQVEVTVHPSIITSLLFPEPVKRVLASDQKHFAVRTMGNAVVIKALRADPTIQANVVITTATLSVTVVLRVTDNASAAQPQVAFKKAEVEAELEKRVEREVARRMAATKAAMNSRVREAIAVRVAQRFEARSLRAVERNGDNIIVRVPRRVRVGADTYVFFRIQNRSDRTYQLARVEVVAAGHDLAGGVVFDGKPARGPILGEVPPGAAVEALVIVRDVNRIKTDAATLVVSEAAGRRRVRVRGVEIR